MRTLKTITCLPEMLPQMISSVWFVVSETAFPGFDEFSTIFPVPLHAPFLAARSNDEGCWDVTVETRCGSLKTSCRLLMGKWSQTSLTCSGLSSKPTSAKSQDKRGQPCARYHCYFHVSFLRRSSPWYGNKGRSWNPVSRWYSVKFSATFIVAGLGLQRRK